MKFVTALLVVKDINISRNFYETILSQKVKYDFGENITFNGDFSIHHRAHYEKLLNGKKIESGQHNVELYFEEDNLDELYSELIKKGVVFVHEIEEQPWKQRVMRFYDPDNYIIEVGESIKYLCVRLYNEGYTINEINKMTGMPEIFIKESNKIPV